MRPVAVLTGAARGIGASVALGLAVAGYDLCLGDVADPHAVAGLGYPLAGPEELADVADRCRALGAVVAHHRCDVRDPAAVGLLVAAAPPGPLVAAVAVAGILGAHGPAWEHSPQDLDRDLAVNLHGVANLARVAVPLLLPAGGRGRFCAVVSAAAQHGLPQLSSYVAAKHAALGYVRSLAADLAPYGVTANAVLPGSTRTALLDRTGAAYGLGSAEEFAGHARLGRLIDPAEVAAAVVWLCSAEAAAVTGAALAVDGGFTG